MFNGLIRGGILLSPVLEWTTTSSPSGVSEYAMSVLLNFVYVFSELSILETGAEEYRALRHSILAKVEKEDTLEGKNTPPLVTSVK